MKKGLKSIIALFSICLVVAFALSLTNYFTAKVIADNEKKQVEKTLQEVLPDGTDFENISIPDGISDSITEIYKAANGGYVFKAVTTGYATGLTIMCGVGSDGTVKGAVCIASNETLGKEKEYGKNFVGKDKNGAAGVDTIASATLTTSAYKKVISDALDAFATLSKGGN